MRIFILEDNSERIKWFKKVFENHELFITSLIGKAHNEAMSKEYDIFFLDHDLEPENITALKEGRTGYDFVKALIADKLQKHAIFYIHSMNPVGGSAIMNLLKDNEYEAQCLPFHLLKVQYDIIEKRK